MKIKLLPFIGVFVSIVLLSSMLFVGITTSQFPPDPPGAYSPWADLNDDGVINIFDIVWMAGRYGETGTEVNKTALLYDVSSTFNMLLDKISALNSTVIEQQTIINNLNSTVILLNETVTIMNGTGLGAPDYDSGWVEIHALQSITLTHNLNTPASGLLVYVLGHYFDGVNWYIHQWYIGGCQYYDPLDRNVLFGAHWDSLNDNQIRVGNLARIEGESHYHEIRAIIWKIPQP